MKNEGQNGTSHPGYLGPGNNKNFQFGSAVPDVSKMYTISKLNLVALKILIFPFLLFLDFGDLHK